MTHDKGLRLAEFRREKKEDSNCLDIDQLLIQELLAELDPKELTFCNGID